MREFLLGMWLAIALVVAGPATWSFAADKPASDDKAATAEKETDKKSADEEAEEKADDMSDAKAEADKKADDADAKAEAKDDAKTESKRVKAKKAEAARAAEKAKAEEQAKKDKAAADKAAAEKAAKKKVRIAYIIVDGALPESPGEMSLFGDLGVDLRKTMARIEKAGDDDTIAAVILQIDAAPGRGKLNELRDSIKRVQSKGKKVYALLESAMGPQYQLASACDEIILPAVSYTHLTLPTICSV